MKWHRLLLVIASLAFIVGTFASELEFDIDDLDEDDIFEDEEILRLLEEKRIMEDLKRENQKAREEAAKYHEQHGLAQGTETRLIYDPCTNIHCQAGRVCVTNDDHTAECVCIPDCPEEYDPRRKVCTNHNETWASDCKVYQQRCFCDTKDSRCLTWKNSHMHIDYYGECKEIQKCSEDEMLDFPRRMKEWLFHVMRELAERQELDRKLVEKMTHIESELNKKWARAAVWKFCSLDQTHDQSVSRHELFPIRAPLLSLEHCIAPFLEGCDKNKDHRITLKEWSKCLGVQDGVLEDKCEDLLGPREN